MTDQLFNDALRFNPVLYKVALWRMEHAPHELTEDDFVQLRACSAHLAAAASEAQLMAKLKRSSSNRATPAASPMPKLRWAANTEARADRLIQAVKAARASHDADANVLADGVLDLLKAWPKQEIIS